MQDPDLLLTPQPASDALQRVVKVRRVSELNFIEVPLMHQIGGAQ